MNLADPYPNAMRQLREQGVDTGLLEHQARSFARMFVTQWSPEIEADPDGDLADLGASEGNELLTGFAQRYARFGTAPFDPEGGRLKFFPGGVSVWSGFPGAGKTVLLRQLICHCLARGSSVFLASFEELPQDTLVRLAATAAGRELPSEHQLQWFLDAFRERLRIWGRFGVAEHAKILRMARVLGQQGIKHVVIDSLMCLDIPNDDFEAQRKFAAKISATARAARIHVHLVAHPRKLISAQQELDINDVAGAREISGIADNVIFIRRLKEKDEHVPVAESSPMVISVRKQRHGTGELGTFVGWYNRSLKQFQFDQFPSGPTRYLPEDAYA